MSAVNWRTSDGRATVSDHRADPADTSPEAYRVQLEIYRRLSPEQRLKLALQMSDFVRKVTASGVRSRHPEYSDEQVRLAVIRLSLGDELFRQAYPGVEIDV